MSWGYTKNNDISNYDVSIVMPFYKKMAEFKSVFPNNIKYILRSGIELIIVMDSDHDAVHLISYMKDFPQLDCRIIANHTPHDWRNPAPVLNVGIKKATKKYVMICSPESEMLTDVIYLLRKTFVDYADFHHFAYGRVCYVDQEVVTYDDYDSFYNIPFGSIMVRRTDLEAIHGYDESFTKWGGDDNNLRARLCMNGVKGLFVESAMMIHRDIHNLEGKMRRSLSIAKLNISQMRHFFYPPNITSDNMSWGNDFEDMIYSSSGI